MTFPVHALAPALTASSPALIDAARLDQLGNPSGEPAKLSLMADGGLSTTSLYYTDLTLEKGG